MGIEKQGHRSVREVNIVDAQKGAEAEPCRPGQERAGLQPSGFCPVSPEPAWLPLALQESLMSKSYISL